MLMPPYYVITLIMMATYCDINMLSVIVIHRKCGYKQWLVQRKAIFIAKTSYYINSFNVLYLLRFFFNSQIILHILFSHLYTCSTWFVILYLLVVQWANASFLYIGLSFNNKKILLTFSTWEHLVCFKCLFKLPSQRKIPLWTAHL